MDRISLTRSDRIDTIIRGAAAGSIAGAGLAIFEMVAAQQAGDGLLWPFRMAASVVLGGGAFEMSAPVALLAGVLVHGLLSVAFGVVAAALYEWSEWSHRHRASQALACLAGAGFGAAIWCVNFPMIGQSFLPWMWRLPAGVQLASHLFFGVVLGLSLRALGRYAINPPDSAWRGGIGASEARS